MKILFGNAEKFEMRNQNLEKAREMAFIKGKIQTCEWLTEVFQVGSEGKAARKPDQLRSLEHVMIDIAWINRVYFSGYISKVKQVRVLCHIL